ncbi:MAG: hypothetical protein NXH85_13170 [Pseudomonadaceae bacterium]|nr:hypothetical protein [Pseudomonadaceae bacterium]
MATPRSLLIDQTTPGFYHLISRCVRQSWLCGRVGTRDYSHRKAWLKQRLNDLGGSFAIEIHAYSILSNHFHLAVFSDPLAPLGWPDEEVVDRWLSVCPPKKSDGEIDTIRSENQRQSFLANADKLVELRQKLGSVSVFMKLLKQPIARRANLEDGTTGHFFEQRFYSGALLDDNAVLAAMAYVDLNPIRARIANSIEASEHTSAHDRLHNTSESIDEYLAPVVSGLLTPTRVPISKREYFARIRAASKPVDRVAPSSVGENLLAHIFSIAKRQRAYGGAEVLTRWLAKRGFQPRERALA